MRTTNLQLRVTPSVAHGFTSGVVDCSQASAFLWLGSSMRENNEDSGSMPRKQGFPFLLRGHKWMCQLLVLLRTQCLTNKAGGICLGSWFRRVLVHQSGKAWQSSSVQVTGTCAGECSHRGSQGDRVGQELGDRYKFQSSTTSDSLPLLKLPELPQCIPKGDFSNMSLWGTFEIQTLTACLWHKDILDSGKMSGHPVSSVPFSKLERTPTFFQGHFGDGYNSLT